MPAVGRLWPSDDDEDADDGGALLSYVSDGRVFLSQDQQHTQMSCPLSCSNHPATWHEVVDDDVEVDVVDDDDNVDDVLVMVINLKHTQISCSNHPAPLLPSTVKWYQNFESA